MASQQQGPKLGLELVVSPNPIPRPTKRVQLSADVRDKFEESSRRPGEPARIRCGGGWRILRKPLPK